VSLSVRREDGYEIDTSAARIDIALVHRWLSTDAYWAIGRSADAVAVSFANSLAYGVFDPGGRQVGVARVVTDHATFAWLCDVYIAPEARGRGLGTWLAQVVTDDVMGNGVPRILLATRDAHPVYAKAGFAPLISPQRWMETDRRGASTPPPDPT
jgi:GNAT superfamily N-acetyltransferase